MMFLDRLTSVSVFRANNTHQSQDAFIDAASKIIESIEQDYVKIST